MSVRKATKPEMKMYVEPEFDCINDKRIKERK